MTVSIAGIETARSAAFEVSYVDRTVQTIPADTINVLTQVRGGIEQDPLEELANSIASEGMLHPPLVAMLDAHHAEQYLIDHAHYYGEQPGNLFALTSIPTPDGRMYPVSVFGHRRLAAYSLNVERGLIDPDESPFSATVRLNISFDEANILQLHENTYEKPPPEEEAVAYRRAYEYYKSREGDISVAELARRINRKSDRVARALDYTALSAEVQELVIAGRLPYGLAAQLHGVQQAYRRMHAYEEYDGRFQPSDRTGQTPDERAAFDTYTFALRIIEAKHHGAGTVKLAERIKGQKEAVLTKLGEQGELELDFTDADSPTAARTAAVNAAARAAIDTLVLLTRTESHRLTPATIAAISATLGTSAVAPAIENRDTSTSVEHIF